MFIDELADYKICSVCDRDNSRDDYDWFADDICPICEAREDREAAERIAAERRRGQRDGTKLETTAQRCSSIR